MEKEKKKELSSSFRCTTVSVQFSLPIAILMLNGVGFWNLVARFGKFQEGIVSIRFFLNKIVENNMVL